MAPQFSNDYWDWACYYLFSYLATQGIATFTVSNSTAALQFWPDPSNMLRKLTCLLPPRAPARTLTLR
jgi:hypothetical protein